MELIYELHEGSQAEKPKAVDTTSSATIVYLRRNIKQITRSDDMGEVTLWQYEEAQCTHDEYDEYVATAQTKARSDIDFIAMMTGVDLDE